MASAAKTKSRVPGYKRWIAIGSQVDCMDLMDLKQMRAGNPGLHWCRPGVRASSFFSFADERRAGWREVARLAAVPAAVVVVFEPFPPEGKNPPVVAFSLLPEARDRPGPGVLM